MTEQREVELMETIQRGIDKFNEVAIVALTPLQSLGLFEILKVELTSLISGV